MDESETTNSLHSDLELHAINVIKRTVDISIMDNSTLRENVDSENSMTDKTVNLKADSRSSSEEGDYRSCSNSVVPEPGGHPVPSESTSNVKMSANMASKLNQMRESRESLDDNTENSEDLTDELHEPPLQDPDAQSTTSRGPSQQPFMRHVFPCISCLPFENNIVFCFVLSVWDNIVGPQTVNVWKRKSFPTQKTFDDMFEGPVEVGEDLTNVRRASIQTLLGMEEAHLGTPTSIDGSWPGKSYESRMKSRRYSSTSMDSEMYSSTEQEWKSPTRRIGRLLSSTRRLSSPRPNKDGGRRLTNSAEAFCEDVGNDILMQSFSAIKDQPKTTERESTLSRSPGSQDKDTLPAPAEEKGPRGGPMKGSVDSEEEPEGQEFGSKWVYGRSRLRVAPVVWYVTVHSVGVGQVGPASTKVTSSLHVVPHQGIIIVAARFTVDEEEGAVPYCLSMVVPLEEYKNFLPLSQMHGLKGGKLVKDKLVELCEVLVALRSASLDQYPLTPAGQPPDDRRFAEVILTSHLQTMGSTVVVADSPNAANKVIMWLAQFSDPSTLPASRLCLSYTQWPFHPGLFIQGIVRSSSGEVNLSAQKLIQSSRPLTVVDVNRGTAKQTGPPDVHARRNSTALRQELVSLWHGLSDMSVPSESLLESVRTAAPLVKRFLHDYDRLSSCGNGVRQDFIRAFLRSLCYTALALITWTQHEWSAQRRKSGYGSLRRALCSVFDLDEADLRVVLAQAEILEPGFYSYVSSMSQRMTMKLLWAGAPHVKDTRVASSHELRCQMPTAMKQCSKPTLFEWHWHSKRDRSSLEDEKGQGDLQRAQHLKMKKLNELCIRIV
ncbi:Guanine nucleotide exchange C9orf72 [Chionoecetes opilio]|uniref:Guanine nucleotide exchange C9orf72 n=1 Tax=Chionoecetes opilio TaxID=41210 RepID=A0A8J4YLG7_CHIOP|nr:Guanine nucleotide exchange C9orf72 [Chionoecetes opilio]